MKVVTRSLYLGGFISDQEEEATWLEERVERWELSVWMMLGVDSRQPQTAYAGLKKSFHQEWAFMQ